MSTVVGSLRTITPHEVTCDYASMTTKTPKFIRDRCTAAGRYISTSATSWKVLTAKERDAGFAVGLDYYLIWEVDAERPMGGERVGGADGFVAVTQARALGYPPGGVIFCANDTDVWAGNIAVFERYNRAFAEYVTRAGYVFGLYGDHDIAQRVIDVCAYVIVPNARAWSGQTVPMNVVARQGREDKVVGWDYPAVVVREFPVWTGKASTPSPVPPKPTVPGVPEQTPPPVVVPPIVIPSPSPADPAVLAAQQSSDPMYFFHNSDAPTDARRFLSNGFVYRHVPEGEADKLGFAHIALNTADTSLPLTTLEIAGQVDVTKVGQ